MSGAITIDRCRDVLPGRAFALASVLTLAGVAGCGGHDAPPPARTPLALPVTVASDTSRAERLAVNAGAKVWMTRVSAARVAVVATIGATPGRGGGPELPGAEPDTLLPAAPEPPALVIDDDLKPPILRASAALAIPRRAPRGRDATVTLDVRIEDDGSVTDALWAEGSEDAALVSAATACALAMRFYPALRSGRPAAVWCRQRFDFGRR